MDSWGDRVPLPDANKRSPRVYTNLQNIDLSTVTFANVEATGDPIQIEDINEDELRRIVLVNLARMCVAGEWTGLLEAGGGGASEDWKLPPWNDGNYWDVAAAAPFGNCSVQGGAIARDMMAWPFISPTSGTISLMAVVVNATVTNTISLAIYTDDDGLPDTLMGYGDFDLSTGTGTLTQDSFSDSIVLEAGTQYWYCCKSSLNAQPNMKKVDTDENPSLGNITTIQLGSVGEGTGINTEVAYGDSLPATLTPGNFTYGGSNAGRMKFAIQF